MNFQISAGSDAQIGAVGSACIQIIDDDEGTNKAPRFYLLVCPVN